MPNLPGPDANDDINSNDIKQEIGRFESVHPSIYSMYDLIEKLTDRRQAESFRDCVARVEGIRCLSRHFFSRCFRQ